MRVALHDSDKTNFPNLALMKISMWHKLCGDTVEWFSSDGEGYDRVYSSKVFTFTPVDETLPPDTIRGGTGYDIKSVLPDYIESCSPDYSLYNLDYSVGFLTRGCSRRCPECFVPDKEGEIKPVADITDFLIHKSVIIMDNNILAHSHGIQQIEKMISLGVKVDFNQGLDARLIDNGMAKLLSKVKWLQPLRLACDTVEMIEPVRRAVEHLRWHNCTPRQYFCYVLVKDIESALKRVRFLKSMYVDPFAQPYRDRNNTPVTDEQRQFARWVNTKIAFKSMTWDEYQQFRGDRI